MNEAFHTERLALRPFTLQDAAAWHAIWGDPQVIWWGASESEASSRAALERLLAREAGWPPGVGWLAVSRRGEEGILGDVLLQPAPFHDGLEIGWHLRPQAWGRGYATEAARGLLERCWREGVCDEVVAIVALQNAPSLRVAERLGMQPVRDMEYAGLPHRLFAIRAPAG